MPFEPNTCVYHHPCHDGFASAVVIKRRWPDVQLIPAEHGQPLPPLLRGDVLFVDFTPSVDQLREVLRYVGMAVIVLDHHKSAKNILEACQWNWNMGARHPNADTVNDGTGGFCLDLTGDAAGVNMAWDFAFPGLGIPGLLTLVSARDRWDDGDGLLEEAHLVSAYLRSLPFSVGAWNSAIDGFEYDGGRELILKAGGAIREFIVQRTEEMLQDWYKAQRWTTIGTNYVPLVSCPHWLSSDVGSLFAERLAGTAKFIAMYEDARDLRTWSLRAHADDAPDLSVIAKAYGGGGHAKAAGFTTPI